MAGLMDSVIYWKTPSVKTLLTSAEVQEMEHVIIASKSGCGMCKHVYA